MVGSRRSYGLPRKGLLSTGGSAMKVASRTDWCRGTVPHGRGAERIAGLLATALAAFFALSAGASAQTLCSDTWTGPSEGNWRTAADWSTGQVPTSADAACIGAGSKVEVSEGSSQPGVVQGEGALVISGGTFELANALESSSIASLTLSGGTLSLAGQLDVSGSLAVSGSSITVTGSGSVVVGSGATGTINSARCARLVLSGVTLVNQGTLTLGASGGAQDGSIAMENGAQLQNAGTFNDDSTEPGGCGFGQTPSLYNSNTGGATPSATNTGTFQASGGAEPVTVGVPFTNQGTVNTENSGLQLSGGGSSTNGTWSVASAATLAFTAGTFTLNSDTWSGPGTTTVAGATVTATSLKANTTNISVSSGSLTIPQGTTISPASLALSGGTLSLAGQLDVSGSLAVSGSSITVTGSGSVVVGSGATGTINSARCARLVLSGVTLVNQGTLTLGASGGAQDGSIAMENGAQLQNAGTFNDDSTEPGGCGFGQTPSLYNSNTGGATPSATNTGTFQASGGAEPVTVGVPFTNQGTVNTENSGLQLSGGGSSTNGTWSVASAATLAFTAGTFTLNSDTWSGPGTTTVAGATVTATSLKANTTNISVSSGSLTIPQGTTISPASLALSGGTLSLAGQLDVSGSLAVSGSSITVTGSGSVVVGSGATGTINSARCARLVLSGVTLVNQGALTLGASGGAQDGSIAMENGAQLQNAGTFNDDSTEPGGCGFGQTPSLYNSNTGGATPSATNTGTFQASGGAEPVTVGVPFTNQGTVNTENSGLQLSGGGSSTNGTWSVASAATLAFTAGTFTLNSDTWSGPGTTTVAGATVTATSLKANTTNISVSSGSLTIPQGTTISPASLALSGGTLSLAGQLDVSGSLAVSGSSITVTGSGSVVVGSGATGTINSARCARLVLSGVTLVNQGTLTLGASGGAQDGSIAMENGAQLQNAGTFNDDSTEPGGCGFGQTPSLYNSNTGGATPSATNTGTFQASGGAEPVTVGVPFTNQGTVNTENSGLQLSGGGSSTNGTWSVASAATLAFTAGTFTLNSDTWSGPGTTTVAGATVTATSLKANTTNISVSSGSLTIPQGTTISPASLALSGGTLSLAGQLDVSGSFAATGNLTVNGAGSLVLGSHLTGTIGNNAACSVHLALSGVTFVNQGTLTFGSGVDVGAGAIAMQEGAQFQNAGTFNDSSYDAGCGFGVGGSSYSFYDTGGAASITNTGTFKSEAGGGTLVVAVPFAGQGTVDGQSGTLQLNGNYANNKLVSLAAGARLSVTGNYTQGENGTLKLAIASTSSYGALSVGDSSALGGLLEVASANGFAGELGQSFAIVSAPGESGAFSYVAGGGLASGESYTPNYSNTGVSLVVANAEGQVPLPVLTSPPHISAGSPQQGETLVLSHGSWEHVPSEYVDQWLRCNESGGGCEPIAGAGGQAYVATGADVGRTIVVQEIARNAGGQSAPADSSPSAVVAALPLRAAAGESVSTFTGAETTLDGAASTPTAEISSYRWEFGDGESAEGAVVRHAYRSPGTYTATLTISRGSEHASQTLTVTVVTPPGADHAAAIRLLTSGETPISEATVLYVAAGGTRIEATTNSRGEGDLAGLPVGEDTVYVYKSGFRPATGTVTVDSEHQGFASITLEPGEVASSGLTSHELTIHEMVEAGINPNEPANQTVNNFEAKLEFVGSITVEVKGNINAEGQFAGEKAPSGTVTGGGTLKCEQQGSEPEHTACETTVQGTGGETIHIIAKPTTIETHPIMQWLILRGSAVTVKQFFEVSMVVQNLSPEEPFGLTAGTTTLDLPSGMSLAPTSEPQSQTQSVAAIPPLGSATTNWIIRGDAPGNYTPSVAYQAQLEPFGTVVSTQAALSRPLEVWGANALATVLKIDSGPAEKGIPYHITLGVKNVSNIPLYNVSVNTSAPVHDHFILQPEQQFTTTIGELRPGQTVSAPQYVLIAQSPREIYGELKEGTIIGESAAELQSVTLAGESSAPATVERVTPPSLYEATSSSGGAGVVHLKWRQVPGAEGYEVFATPSLETPFGEHPIPVSATPGGSGVTVLPATASEGYVSGSSSAYYAVSTLIAGHLVLDHPLVEAAQAERENKEKEEEETRKKEEEEELKKEMHEREKEAKKEKHEGEPNPAEPDRRQCKSGDAINCATGNHTETQTDLALAGHGPALNVVRTYSSKAAVRQAKPGPFGYGWTSPHGAYVTISRSCSHVNSSCGEGTLGSGSATVHQDNGSTVFFSKQEGAGAGKEGWTSGPLVQATLVEVGNHLIFTLPGGQVLTFDTTGHLSSHLGPLKFFTITEGTAPISSEADRNGNTLAFSYNGSGQLTTITGATERKISLAYNAEGQIATATDPMGHTVKYGYQHGNLVSVTEPGESNPRWQFAYDSLHQMTSATEAGTHTTFTEYDGLHRAIAQTDPMGHKRTWTYLTIGSGSQTRITEPNGSTTVEQFNGEGSPTSIARAAGSPLESITLDEYNGQEQLISTTNPAGGKTTYTYDSTGNRASETDPLGNTSKWTYNAQHETVTETKPSGETTTITRDARGNPTEVSRPAPGGQTQTTKHTYDSAGDMTSTTDPLGRQSTYTYDARGDRESETDPVGNKRTFTYDEDSHLTATVSPLGNVAGAEPAKFKTTLVLDAQGRVVETLNPLGHTVKTTYNAAGQIASLTDANGKVTTYAYDADNEPIKVTEPNGDTRETEYDAADQAIAHIDGDHHKTTYVRDLLEQVTEVKDPLGHKTTKAYDVNGNLTGETNPEGKTTTFGYDAGNRETKVSYSDGKTPAAEYEYNADGYRTKMIDGSGTTTYVYDSLDRLVESVDGHGDKTAYEYDLAGEQTGVLYPNGKAVAHTFDADGRLKSTTDWLGSTTTFTYNADSAQTATTFPHASEGVDTFTYNDADELTKTLIKKGKTTLASLTYTRAKNGAVTKTTTAGLPGEAKTSFLYDASNRLTQAGSTAYEYDAAGNPTKIATVTNTFNAASELTATSTGTTYAYNEQGERIKATPATGPATTYAYDQAGNQTAVSRPGEGSTPLIEETYAYNGDRLRVSQSSPSNTTYLTWDTAEQLPLLLSEGANSYLYGPNGLPTEQITSANKVLYLHHDQQGSTRMLTGPTGAVEGAFTYGGYGSLTSSTGTATTPLGYDGQYTEPNTGLIYLRARSYEPATAQFTSVDPAVATTWAPYSYAQQNPVNAGDPSGLASAAEITAETVLENLSRSDETERQLFAERVEAEKTCDLALAAQKEREEKEVKDRRSYEIRLLVALNHTIGAEERRRILIEWYGAITEYFAKTYACELPLSLIPGGRLVKVVAGAAGNVCAQWASPDETDG